MLGNKVLLKKNLFIRKKKKTPFFLTETHRKTLKPF
jgi:hypothetical protein